MSAAQSGSIVIRTVASTTGSLLKITEVSHSVRAVVTWFRVRVRVGVRAWDRAGVRVRVRLRLRVRVRVRWVR